MRVAAILLALLGFATPALAAESIADQASRAYEIFAGGQSQQGFLSATYGQVALRGIDGSWVRLNGPDPRTGIETYGADTEKFCKGAAALTLASADPLTLTITTNLPANNFTETYTLIAGSTFGEHTPSAPYLAMLGLGLDKTGDAADAQRALALSLANGLVQIYRPSDDILVMTRDRGYPLILARCPAPAPDVPPK